MYADDFEYNGMLLSDFDCVICSFEQNSGFQVRDDIGGNITFTSVPMGKGIKYTAVGSKFDSYLTTNIEICKDPNTHSDNEMIFSSEEYRKINRWLNTESYNAFKIIPADNDYTYDDSMYYMAHINATKIELYNQIVGFKLTITTDSPFAYLQDVEEIYTLKSKADEETNCESDSTDTDSHWKITLLNKSDYNGVVYCGLTVKEIGKVNDGSEYMFSVKNENLVGTTEITNFIAQDMTFKTTDKLQIDKASRQFNDYFNYIFPRIARRLTTVDDQLNTFDIHSKLIRKSDDGEKNTSAFTVTISYTPLVYGII